MARTRAKSAANPDGTPLKTPPQKRTRAARAATTAKKAQKAAALHDDDQRLGDASHADASLPKRAATAVKPRASRRAKEIASEAPSFDPFSPPLTRARLRRKTMDGSELKRSAKKATPKKNDEENVEMEGADSDEVVEVVDNDDLDGENLTDEDKVEEGSEDEGDTSDDEQNAEREEVDVVQQEQLVSGGEESEDEDEESEDEEDEKEATVLVKASAEDLEEVEEGSSSGEEEEGQEEDGDDDEEEEEAELAVAQTVEEDDKEASESEEEEEEQEQDQEQASESEQEDEVEQQEQEQASESEQEEEASESEQEEEEEAEEEGDIISRMIASKNQNPNKSPKKQTPVEQDSESEDDEESAEEDEESLSDDNDSDDDDEEERALEMALFGSLKSKQARKELEAVNSGAKARELRNGDLFVEDKGASSIEESPKDKKSKKDEARKVAWEDDDDADIHVNLKNTSKSRKLREDLSEQVVDGKEYSKRLREQFRKMNRNADWAELPSRKRARRNGEASDDEGEDEELALLRSSEPLTRRASEFRRLPPGRLQMTRLNDANQHAPSKSVVQSVDWHKQGQLMATAGYDKALRIFKVDGKVNARVESVNLRDMPIFNAQFAGRNHEQIICVGRRPFFYWLDLESGSVGKIPSLMGRSERSLESMTVAPDGSLMAFMGYDGNVILASQDSKQWVANVKMNENASCAAFTRDGRYLYSGGDHGRVYCWDMRTRRILFKFQDQGSTWTRSIAVSPYNDRLAVGSSNGVVNLYDVDKVSSEKSPDPLKAIMSLTTAVDQVKFNSDGQLLAMLSRRKKDSVRLFNTNTMTVVQNWPTASTPIHYASAVSFSPGSGMLALGNDRGRCLLYRLNHYKSAA